MPGGTLEELGLRAGERVRWRRRDGGRWAEGVVVGRERDGSIGVRDARSRSRALPADRLEVESSGPRGARTWEPVPVRAGRTEQGVLFR